MGRCLWEHSFWLNLMGTSASSDLDVLIVEESNVPQRLVESILTSVGHEVAHASDAIKALQIYFDRCPRTIIAHLQTPELSGLQTVAILAAIRPSEGTTSIIATAPSMDPQVQERCLAAGADAFLAQPFDEPELAQLLANLAVRKESLEIRDRTARSCSACSPQESSEPVIQPELSLARLGGDRKLLTELIGFFLEDFPGLLSAARESLAQGDWTRAQRAAHSLKGLTANFDAQPAVRALQTWETSCSSRDLAAVDHLRRDAERQLARVVRALVEQYDAISGTAMPDEPISTTAP